jgi:Xaa-Pro aminopeptidase
MFMGIVKTAKEIAIFRKSAAITDSCIPVIEKSLREPGITERELARRINRNIRRQGAGLSFLTIVASGKRSFQGHPRPRAMDKPISGIGYADFGASFKGYKTDITVPFIKGDVGKAEEKIVKTTLQAYEVGKSSVRIGRRCWESFKEVDDFLRSKGFIMIHEIGHGLGRRIHERPFIVIPSSEKMKRSKSEKARMRWNAIKNISFQEGSVFTIEPGIYVKGVGGCRLENDFLLTKKGLEQLTKSRLIRIR